MGEQGTEASSFAQVIEHARSPRRDLSPLPRGKAQLVAEATPYASKAVEQLLSEAVSQHDDNPVAAADAIVSFWRKVLSDRSRQPRSGPES
jgi:hypothetical protein